MPRVLVVDDEPLMRDILRRMLQTEGYEVEEAEDGLEGLQRYRAVPADLVITDLHMPRLSGLDMIKELLHEFPNVKVIMISGDGDMMRNVVQALGIQETLQKPFEMNAVMAAVHITMANGNLTGHP